MISDDMAGVSTPAPGRVAGAETLCGYIDAHWDRTVRTSDGTAGELALPCRFMCPTVGETFRSLFYWDTFYACTGLVLQGREALVEECLRCFLHLIDELGFVPNMTTIGEINRTQLPHAWRSSTCWTGTAAATTSWCGELSRGSSVSGLSTRPCGRRPTG